MDIRAIGPNPNTSKPRKAPYKFPYLLRDLTIDRANQVWACDITFIAMKHGFMYLFATIDLFSRYIINWSISNTMTAQWCVSAISEAFLLNGHPQIMNSDQGSQFTADLYVDQLKEKQVQISMPACRPAGTAKVEPLTIFSSSVFGEASNRNMSNCILPMEVKNYTME